jgi:ankyrin repeat protein
MEDIRKISNKLFVLCTDKTKTLDAINLIMAAQNKPALANAQQSQTGDTALMIALKKDHLEIVDELLKIEGIDINIQNQVLYFHHILHHYSNVYIL